MTRFHFERPDGRPKGENILIHLNEFVPPQGYGGGAVIPPVVNGWIDDLGNQIVDDLGNTVVFEL